MARQRALNASQKKTLIIVASVVVVIAAAIAGAITVFAHSNKGQEVTQNAQQEFKPIEVPQDSSQLTAVKDAPVGKKDKDDDPYIAVDLRGKKVKQSDIPGDSHSSSTTTSNKKGHGNKPQHNSPQERRSRTQELHQVSNIGKRVKIPSLRANFALGSLREPKNGVIEPTNFTSVFWITNRGVKYNNTKNGTAYLAAHALDQNGEGNGLSGLAPGNWLYDTITKKSKLNPGDIMEVGGVKFKFVESHRAGKGLIARDKDLWNEKKKNRLVFLTCISSSNDNHVAVFERA